MRVIQTDIVEYDLRHEQRAVQDEVVAAQGLERYRFRSQKQCRAIGLHQLRRAVDGTARHGASAEPQLRQALALEDEIVETKTYIVAPGAKISFIFADRR